MMSAYLFIAGATFIICTVRVLQEHWSEYEIFDFIVAALSSILWPAFFLIILYELYLAARR